MERVTAPSGITVSYDRYGQGPPLVLVHGGFSDHLTNWERVRPLAIAVGRHGDAARRCDALHPRSFLPVRS